MSEASRERISVATCWSAGGRSWSNGPSSCPVSAESRCVTMDKEKFDDAVHWARLVQQLSPSYGRDPEFSFETTLREFARSEGFEDDLMLRLVQESKQHSWAWDVLNSLVLRIFRTGPRDMPEIVWQWAADKMEGIVSQPRRGRLRRPVDCIAIVDTVHIVKARFGVSSTRNRPEFADCCAEGGIRLRHRRKRAGGEPEGVQGVRSNLAGLWDISQGVLE